MEERQRVINALTFNHPDRLPRDIVISQWAKKRYPETIRRIFAEYPVDIEYAEYSLCSFREEGNPLQNEFYTDAWGCRYRNILKDVAGFVQKPLIRELGDWKKLQPPYERLPKNYQEAYSKIQRQYEKNGRFIIAPSYIRPWERYQLLRGSEQALSDILLNGKEFRLLLQKIHDYYLKELEFWAGSKVDALFIMDDWGAQDRLLISPEAWRFFFKPLYAEYVRLAKDSNKFIFMHSDGYIQSIIPDLIELGMDALNAQWFLMDFEKLAQFVPGNICFWGEMDQQNILTSKDLGRGREAVRKIWKYFYRPDGGIINQLKFGIDARPKTVEAVLDEWTLLENRQKMQSRA